MTHKAKLGCITVSTGVETVFPRSPVYRVTIYTGTPGTDRDIVSSFSCSLRNQTMKSVSMRSDYSNTCNSVQDLDWSPHSVSHIEDHMSQPVIYIVLLYSQESSQCGSTKPGQRKTAVFS